MSRQTQETLDVFVLSVKTVRGYYNLNINTDRVVRSAGASYARGRRVDRGGGGKKKQKRNDRFSACDVRRRPAGSETRGWRGRDGKELT